MTGTLKFVNILRIWIGFVAVMAIGNTVQCFISNTYLYDRLYTINKNNVSGLTARLFGVWTLLAGGLRLLCALHIENRVLYHTTLFSFFLAQLHFLSEVFVYKTAAFTAGIIAPVIVSSVSILLMLIGYWFVEWNDPRAGYTDENEQILKGSKKSK
ncbi:ergosterol biosynthetic protein 28 homolog [Aplysia californica]|uniref:Ergosterol biosynthetic protein 28 homolog n=1 Tax=Aplysia californica TaxID=6500 RepID=A0ABM0JB74_APLCA|nr:ergosterol biosynthetic protein 28 homolog [Aplysia californica]